MLQPLQPQSLVLGRYRVVRLAGQGGMGAVYEAYDERLSTTVALKQITIDLLQLVPEQAAAARRAFEREAKLLAGLRHPALPRVIDYFADGPNQFLVMDFIPGDDLAVQVKAHRTPFPIALVLDWADTLLDALTYLHGQSAPVLHRDIKPQNIKLTPQGAIVLLDFGLARGSVSGQTTITTSGSLFAYTPQYAPLEQVQGHATTQSDLYSLAATLYHLLAGEPPPDVMRRVSALAANTTDPLLPLASINPLVPAPVSAALQRSLALHADDRPASAEELRRLLREARSGQASTSTTRFAVTPQANRSRPPVSPSPRRWWGIGVLIGILVLFGAGIGRWLLQHPESTPIASAVTSGPAEQAASATRSPTQGVPPIVAAATATAFIAPTAAGAMLAASSIVPPTPAPLPPALGGVVSERVLTGHTSGVGAVAVSPDGQIIASGASDDTIRLWRLSDGAVLKIFQGHTDWVGGVAFTPDGQTLVSGANDGTIRLWRVTDGQALGTLTGHNGPVFEVATSPDGQLIGSGGRDTTVHLWRVADGALVATLKGHTDWVGAVAFHPNTSLLASGANDGTVRLWRVSDGVLLTTLEGQAGPIHDVTFSPDGQLLAAAAGDGTLQLWRMPDGQLVRTIMAHTDTVWAVAFSPDGMLLASGSADRTVGLWRVADGGLLARLKGHSDAVISVAFTPDSRALVSGSNDSTVRIWPIPAAP